MCSTERHVETGKHRCCSEYNKHNQMHCNTNQIRYECQYFVHCSFLLDVFFWSYYHEIDACHKLLIHMTFRWSARYQIKALSLHFGLKGLSTSTHLFGLLLSFPVFLSVEFLSIWHAIIDRAAFYQNIWLLCLKDSQQTEKIFLPKKYYPIKQQFSWNLIFRPRIPVLKIEVFFSKIIPRLNKYYITQRRGRLEVNQQQVLQERGWKEERRQRTRTKLMQWVKD